MKVVKSERDIACEYGQEATGFTSPAQDYLSERLSLDKILVANPLSTFYFKVSGSSMLNAFIPNNAMLVVDRSIKPVNGKIIVGVLDGEFVVYRLIKNEYRTVLKPENSKCKEIEVTKEMDFKVWGVVTYIITDTKMV